MDREIIAKKLDEGNTAYDRVELLDLTQGHNDLELENYLMNTRNPIVITTGMILLTGLVIILPLPASSQQHLQPTEPDQDNIYHEDDHLPDDADIFPRMGHTIGLESESNNCRSSAWGTVVHTIPGDAFIEVDDRSVDRNGESWFHVSQLNCWVHDSRIDLL